MTFDPNFPGFFTGECLRFEVKEDPAVSSGVPNLVIDPSKPFDIELEWQLCGGFVPTVLSGVVATGSPNWIVEVYAESMGPGPEIRIAQAFVPVFPIPPLCAPVCWCYSKVLTATPGLLEEHAPGPAGPSGIYKLTSAIFLNATSIPAGDICGFCEGPMIKAENPE